MGSADATVPFAILMCFCIGLAAYVATLDVSAAYPVALVVSCMAFLVLWRALDVAWRRHAWLVVLSPMTSTFAATSTAHYAGWAETPFLFTGLSASLAAFHIILMMFAMIPAQRAPYAWLLLSNLLFLGAMMLRWDVGDGSDWLTITAMTGPGAGYPDSEPPPWLYRWTGVADGDDINGMVVFNVLALVPTVVCWGASARASRGGQAGHLTSARPLDPLSYVRDSSLNSSPP